MSAQDDTVQAVMEVVSRKITATDDEKPKTATYDPTLPQWCVGNPPPGTLPHHSNR